MKKEYETVIGLEVHIELATRTKLFCGCSTAFGGAPNSQTCPVCTGMPGALPVLNRRAVEYAVAVGLATNCRIAGFSQFDRKNYFYPDNPQNYQISQWYLPVCRDGGIAVETPQGEKMVGIRQIHLEEDAAKLIHDEEEGCTLVDYNRSGVPLIEVVSQPDLRSAQETVAWLEKLRLLVRYLGASDCRMQEGSMRVDVNLSVREKGSMTLGVRTEMKNLNSFRAVVHAIENESRRQTALLEEGHEVRMETRRWDEDRGCSCSMRSKEDARDYRYFPEPDLPPVVLSEEWIEPIRRRQPEMPDAKMARYQSQFGLPAIDARILTSEKELADRFEAAAALCGRPKKVSNWLIGETLRLLREHGMPAESLHFSPENLAKLIELQESGVISAAVAKKIFERIFAEDADPETYVKEHNLKIIGDEETVRGTALRIMKENPRPVEDYCRGKEKAAGFLVGQTMRALGGKADPAVVNRTVRELLAGRQKEND